MKSMYITLALLLASASSVSYIKADRYAMYGEPSEEVLVEEPGMVGEVIEGAGNVVEDIGEALGEII